MLRILRCFHHHRHHRSLPQAVELKATSILHVGECEASTYPMAKKKTSYEFLREKMHLRPRTNTIGAVARIRNALAYATHRCVCANVCVYWCGCGCVYGWGCESMWVGARECGLCVGVGEGEGEGEGVSACGLESGRR